MSGWCPSSSVCGMAVVCAVVVVPGAVVWLVPYSSHCGAGEYCSSCRALLLIGSGAVVWWGILCLLPPHSGGGWGHRGWWGGIADGGWHGEGRAAVLLTPRLVCGVPRLCAGVPPCRLPCGPIEWREWCVLCRPRVRVGSGTLCCSAPLHVVRSPRIVLVLLLSCVAVFVVGGEVWWRVSRAA